MNYSKPELLSVEAALDGIRGDKSIIASDEGFDGYTIPSYEVDE